MTIPYLVNFIPDKVDGVLCQSINDMVSINLQQNVPLSTINYNIGSFDDVSIPLSVKNITNNAELEVELVFDGLIFLLNGEETAQTAFKLIPGEIVNVQLSLNKSSLDTASTKIETSVSVVIRNISNNGIVTKNSSVSLLNMDFLNDTVTLSTQ